MVICGFGELGQVVANIIMAPPQPRSDVPPVPYVAFDIHADRVNQARAHGFNCLYGDASRAQVSCMSKDRAKQPCGDVSQHAHDAPAHELAHGGCCEHMRWHRRDGTGVLPAQHPVLLKRPSAAVGCCCGPSSERQLPFILAV